MSFIVAVLLLAQDKGAEDLYAQIEKQLLDAKSLRVTFQVDGSYELKKKLIAVKQSGSLFLKAGNKFRFEVAMTFDAVKSEKRILSDGTISYRNSNGDGKEEWASTAGDLTERVAACLTRSGAAWQIVGPLDGFPPPGRRERPVKLKEVTGPKGQRVLEYEYGVRSEEVRIVLRVDATSLKPKSRDLTCDTPVFKMSLKETYSEFAVNEEIADSKFATPIRDDARIDKAKEEMLRLYGAIHDMRIDTGAPPTTAQGLKALLTAPAGIGGWKGPYLRSKEIPKDPWGNEYQYECPGKNDTYDLYSNGPDGKSGTADDIKG